MADNTTKIAQLIDPEVMADMISAKIPKKIRVAPFAKVDATLQGVPGSTITVPSYAYIGDAVDVAEGAEVAVTQMATSTKTITVKKAMKSVALTDEAVLCGYGDPVGEASAQLGLSIAAKLDNDAMDALLTAKLTSGDGSKGISYETIVDAVDVFEEEVNTQKVMFVHPKQVTQLRKDANFISADKYPGNVMMTGEVGMIANTRIVPSKKVALDSGSAYYTCPLVKLEQDSETEGELPALTVYLKRETEVETARVPRKAITEITTNKHYTVALTNEAKAVLVKLKK